MPNQSNVDVVVIGAGAAGLAAALAAYEAGAKVAVLEKGDRLGGTASISGGIVWMPQNPQMAAAGIPDSREEALSYFKTLDQGDIDPALLEALVDEGPAALRFLEGIDAFKAVLLDAYPDYYLDSPGAKPNGGRALDNALFSFDALGEWAGRIYDTGMPMRFMLKETPLGGACGMVDPAILAEREATDQRGWGQALIGRLLKACLDRAIVPQLSASVQRLMEADGRITGVVLGSGETITASKGVVLATGGFEWDKDLAQTFLRGPMTAPNSPPGNTGDGLKMAMRAGAKLGNMTSAWWMTSLTIPGDHWPTFAGIEKAQRSVPVLLERTFPHSLMVNGEGKRFCNEANNYSALSGAFHSFDPQSYSYKNNPAYLIFDEQFRAKYPFTSVMPGMDMPNWVTQAGSISDLADALEIDAAALEGTFQSFNDAAQAGEDKAFGRGKSDYDHFYGDRSRPGAMATLGTLEKPPYYAVKIEVGTLGTNGGPKTTAQAQVISSEGAPIDGLYAAGNVMAGATGGVYAGAGGTLGPALTFGVVAGRAAAQG